MSTTLPHGAAKRKLKTTDPTTWIYFQGADDGSVIKIGESSQSRNKRLQQNQRQLGVGSTAKLVTLAEVRGMGSDEKAVLRAFRDFNIEYEWFRPERPLVDYIRWLRNQWFVCVEETTDEERESMKVVDSSTWLPNDERRLSPSRSLLPGMNELFDLGPRQVTGDDFYTNQIIIDAARRVMGSIDTDPATHAEANRVVQAKTFYTIADNGLEREWSGNVWINPPFSKWGEWVPKIIREWRSGRITEMCVLSAMRTVTAKYFAPFLNESDGMVIMHGRIPFWGGKAGDSPDDGHCVFYFGNRLERFREAFSELGTVFGKSSLPHPHEAKESA